MSKKMDDYDLRMIYENYVRAILEYIDYNKNNPGRWHCECPCKACNACNAFHAFNNLSFWNKRRAKKLFEQAYLEY